jgi:L-amino acid N-acyltransferase YncA
MLLFRSEETVNAWCAANYTPRRPLVNLEQLWQLAVTWYGSRLTVESRRPGPNEMVSIFASLGLTGPFWDPKSDQLEIKIRLATESDRDAIWKIFQEVIAAGETYPIDSNVSRDEALRYWFKHNAHVFVAESGARIVGSYTLHQNQAAGGAHVANAGFIVGKEARGGGIGRAMGEHCLSEARRLGFRAMQFNFVVSTNESAVKLWQELGMKIVGILPGAFRHPTRGYVDVYVMYQEL